jgi:hypothetical protein
MEAPAGGDLAETAVLEVAIDGVDTVMDEDPDVDDMLAEGDDWIPAGDQHEI